MNTILSRRKLLKTTGATFFVSLGGCLDNQPRPVQFEIRTKDAVRLNIVITSEDANETVYEQSHSFESDAVLKIGKDTLQNPPYNIEFQIDSEAIWNTIIGTCNHLAVSVNEEGEVEIVEHTAC